MGSCAHRGQGACAKAAAVAALVCLVFYCGPYVLLLGGAWPTPGTTLSTVLLFALLIVANTASVVSIISATSMVAEIVEAFEERTGKRAEGTFYSGNWLVQKCATGGGILLTSLIVQSIDLAPGTPQGEVDAETVERLVLSFVVVASALALCAAYWLGRFPITRAQHEARVAARLSRQSPHEEHDPIDEAVRADPDAHSITP